MTGKRYHPQKRDAALKCLEALGGSVALTTELTGIPRSSLQRWARQQRKSRHRARQAFVREKQSGAVAAEARVKRAETRLAQVRQEHAALLANAPAAPVTGPASPHARLQQLAMENMLQEATRLSESLGEAIADAPLGQRATALNQLLDKILKVLALLPRQEEVLVRVEFHDPNGSTHKTPFWARKNSDE